MNTTTAASASPANVIELPMRSVPQTGVAKHSTITQGHELGGDDVIRWCELNELLFAIEVDGIMEISTAPHA